MKRKLMTKLILFLTAVFITLPSVGLCEGTQQPNFVVILVDDLRWDELGCTGHSFAHTPNIDRIAREGAEFRNAFCTTPLCSPARASLLTGLYTHHHGILDNTNRSEDSHKLKTFPRLLQQSGYETGYVGKWHMGNDDSARPGFDYWVSMKGQGTSFDPMLNVNGIRSKYQGHTTDVLNEKSVEFIKQQRDTPFCLYIAHKALHPELVQYDDGSISDPGAAKFLPAKRHKELYTEDAIPWRLNVTDTLSGKPALHRKVEGLPALSRKTGTSAETVRDRLRMLAAVDDGVGLLFSALTEIRQLDNTVLVLLSDHGYWYGEHGLSVERRLAYEEGLRIPFMVRYPSQINSGSVIDEFALNVDLAPTLLEFAGTHTQQPMDGVSLVPLLKGERPKNWRTSFLVEYNTDTVFPRVYKMGYRAIRTKRWKYIHFNELDGMDELYDMKNDPFEMENVIGEPDKAEILQQLQLELKNLFQEKR